MGRILRVVGAKEHNLENISVDLPRDKLVVLTGVSGSGKSSLAFDTIFREGQRRYVESLSSYARQFIGQMGKPAVEKVEGISPAICIDQKTVNRNPRSTVGTSTEVLDHLRLLYARLGDAACPVCGEKIEARTPGQIADRLLFDRPDENCLLMAPVVRRRKGEYRAEQEEWKTQGYRWARIDGVLHDLETAMELERYEIHTLELGIDRLRIEDRTLPRLREGIQKALRLAEGVVSVLTGPEAFEGKGKEGVFSALRACPNGHVELPELEPRCFSFNHPQGACPECKGLGVLRSFEENLLVPNPAKSLSERGLAAITDKGTLMFSDWGPREIRILGAKFGFDAHTPWNRIPAAGRKAILHTGLPERNVRGAVPVLQELWEQWHISLLHKFMRSQVCPGCHGTRLGIVSRTVKFRGRGIAELTHMTISDLAAFFQAVQPSEFEFKVGREIFREIRERLFFLDAVGLGYLSLDRSANTLSGGEAQRIRLASQVGAGLQGVLYVLDEPSIGLHPRDNKRLLSTLRRLRDKGNSVLVVEHDQETMQEADHVVDIGPGAGALGGRIVGEGHWTDLVEAEGSPTGRFLSGRDGVPMPEVRRDCGKGVPRLVVRGCQAHNLKNVDLSLPLGRFVALTGVSGSGKSTFLDHILGPALANALQGAEREVGEHSGMEGLEGIEKVVEIDQAPIGRTPRSNPATYTGVFDEIRALFANLPESKARGYKAGRFSFNVAGGRCEACEGAGLKVVEMQLLSNVEVGCEECGGRRFNPPTLEVHYKGKTIHDVLEMTIDEALEFFLAIPKISRGLQTLQDIGLGYVKIGQPSTTLSGGEAQRIKLASELQKPSAGKTLYLLDEPTTGLHFQDVSRLVESIQALVERGNTVLVVEHNLDLVRAADWVLDLGPEGGAAGGYLCAEGTPEQVAKAKKSPTGPYLAQALEEGRAVNEWKTDVGTVRTQNFASPRQGLSPRSVSRERDLPMAAEPAPDLDIRVRGACKHNLKNISVRIPRHSLTVITGPSGSGKTSLAFDTLFAEGQRRFVESLSTYARRFLGRLDRGEADSFEGLSPAIAIDQKTASRSPRSTVATLTEIYDYLRLLWCRAGIQHDPATGEVLRGWTAAEAVEAALRAADGHLLSVWAPLHIPGSGLPLFLSESSQLPRVAEQLLELGFETAEAGGKEIDLRKPPTVKDGVRVFARVDRLKARSGEKKRLQEAVLKARDEAHGICLFRWDGGELWTGANPIEPKTGYWQKEPWEPKHFSFNSHFGACPACEGLGGPKSRPCPVCHGERLRPETAAVRVGGKRLPEFVQSTVDEALDFCRNLKLKGAAAEIAVPVLRELLGRLSFLSDVGVGYLALNRSGNTLSGGEAQRIRLASQIGSGLEGVLYVLDEPTTGLHQTDTAKLVRTLRRLRDLGNTVVVVEHDPELIRDADHVVDMGPGAGEEGGEVVASGPLSEILEHPESRTALYMSGRKRIERPRLAVKAAEWIRVRGATLHNLKSVDVDIPMGRLTGIAGVSGSGKSSLALDLMVPGLEAAREGKRKIPGLKTISVGEEIQEVVLVDQSPIGTTPRSTPASFCGVWENIREFFAAVPEAKAKGWDRKRFQFNGGNGRCPVCEGRGAVELEMHFLSDVWVKCEACGGKRFDEDTLSIRFRGRNVADVLAMRVDEAEAFFSFHRKTSQMLGTLRELGLGYLRLGQPATELSGGESQRLKLAEELGRVRRGRAVYILDEPTTGLHLSDIDLLVQALDRLVARGDTVIVVEHQLDVLEACDWLVELGPGGGEEGGKVLFQGPPGVIPARTPTGGALRTHRKR
jgi:excinuclease ABC subunit A